MRILLIHPGPDFSVHDVITGWYEAFRELGVDAAVYNFNDRLVFYSNVLVNTQEYDETGHPICKSLAVDQVTKMAMQGMSHALYTFWPDVVMFVSAFFTTAGLFQLIRQRRHKIVILHTESPYLPR